MTYSFLFLKIRISPLPTMWAQGALSRIKDGKEVLILSLKAKKMAGNRLLLIIAQRLLRANYEVDFILYSKGAVHQKPGQRGGGKRKLFTG